MNHREVAQVLAKAAAFDRRTVGEADIMAWHEAIGDLAVEEALAGVTRWYRDRADWLMPSHLREAVRLVRADRRREARIEEAEKRASAAREEPARRRWDALPPLERQRLSDLSRGLLERWPGVQELTSERFTVPVRPSLYGVNGHKIEGSEHGE